MPANSEKEEKKGLLGRLWGSKKTISKVRLDTNDDLMYYNKELGMWVERGKEAEAAAAKAGPPPPPSTSSSLHVTPSNSTNDLNTMNGSGSVASLTAANSFSMGRNAQKDPRKRYPDPLLAKSSKQPSTLGKTSSFAQLLPTPAGPGASAAPAPAKLLIPPVAAPALFVPSAPAAADARTADGAEEDAAGKEKLQDDNTSTDHGMSSSAAQPRVFMPSVPPVPDEYNVASVTAQDDAAATPADTAVPSMAVAEKQHAQATWQEDSGLSGDTHVAAAQEQSADGAQDAASTQFDQWYTADSAQPMEGAGPTLFSGVDTPALAEGTNGAFVGMDSDVEGTAVHEVGVGEQGNVLAEAPAAEGQGHSSAAEAEAWTDDDQQNYTYWSQLQQYAVYYRQEGYGEEQIAEYFAGQGTTEQLTTEWVHYYNDKWARATASGTLDYAGHGEAAATAAEAADATVSAAGFALDGAEVSVLGSAVTAAPDEAASGPAAVTEDDVTAGHVAAGSAAIPAAHLDSPTATSVGYTAGPAAYTEGTQDSLASPAPTMQPQDGPDDFMTSSAELRSASLTGDMQDGVLPDAGYTGSAAGQPEVDMVQPHVTPLKLPYNVPSQPQLDGGSPGSQPSQSVSLASWGASKAVIANKAEAKLTGSMPWGDLGPKPATRSNSEASTPRIGGQESADGASTLLPLAAEDGQMDRSLQDAQELNLNVQQVVQQAIASLAELPAVPPVPSIIPSQHAASSLHNAAAPSSFEVSPDLTLAGWQVMEQAVPDLLEPEPSEASVTGPFRNSGALQDTGASFMMEDDDEAAASVVAEENIASDVVPTAPLRLDGVPSAAAHDVKASSTVAAQPDQALLRAASLSESCASAPVSTGVPDAGDMAAPASALDQQPTQSANGLHEALLEDGGSTADLSSLAAPVEDVKTNGWGFDKPGKDNAEETVAISSEAVPVGTVQQHALVSENSPRKAPVPEAKTARDELVTDAVLQEQWEAAVTRAQSLQQVVNVLEKEKGQLLLALEQAKDVTAVASEAAALQADAMGSQKQLSAVLSDINLLVHHVTRLQNAHQQVPTKSASANGWDAEDWDGDRNSDDAMLLEAPVLQTADSHQELLGLAEALQVLAGAMLQHKQGADELRQQQAQQQEQQAAVEADAASLRAQLARQAEEVAHLRQQLEAANGAEALAGEDRSYLQEQLRAAAIARDEALAQVADLKEALEAEQAAAQQAKQQSVELQAQLDAAQEAALEATEGQSQAQQLQEQVDLLRETLEEQGSELASATEVLMQKDKELALLREASSSECAQLQHQLEAQSQELQDVQERLNQQEATAQEAAQQLLELSGQLEEANAAKQKAESRAVAIKKKAEQLLRSNKEMKEQLAVQQANNQAVSTEEVSALQQQVAALEEELATYRITAAEAAAAADKLAEQHSVSMAQLQDHLQTQITAAQEELASKTALAAQAAETLQRVEEQLAQAQTQAAAAAESVQLQQHAFAAEKEALAQQLQDAAATAAEQQEALHAARDKLQAAQQKVEQQEQTVVQLQEQLAAAQQKLGAASELAEAAARVEELEAAVADRDEQIDMLRESLTDANELLQVSESAADSLREELATAQQRAATVEAELQASSSQQQAAAAELLDLQQQLAAAQATAVDSAGQAERLQRQLEEAQAEQQRLAESAAQQAALLGERDGEVQKQVEALQEQLAALQAELDSRDKERQLNQRKLAKAKQELKARADAKAVAESESGRLASLVEELQAAREADAAQLMALQEQVMALESNREALEASMQSAVATMQGTKDVTLELQHVQEELAAQQSEFNDLLACLGQETAKVTALQALLEDKYQEDVTELLDRVEEEYGFGEEGEEEGDEGMPVNMLPLDET